jgi:hypothetical protein
MFISNYGNLTGPNEKMENNPIYINDAIKANFYVHVNVFFINGTFFTGNIVPKYIVTPGYLQNEKILCSGDNETKNILRIYNIKIYEKDKGFIVSDFIKFYKQKSEAKIRYAMIISGTIRRYSENLLKQIHTYHEKNPDKWIDIFVSLNSEENDFTKKFYNDIWPISLQCKVFEADINMLKCKNIRPEYTELSYAWDNNSTDYPEFLKTNKVFGNQLDPKSLLPPNMQFKPRFDNISNFLSMFYNQYRAFNDLEEYSIKNNLKYKNVIVYRTDIVADELPNIDIDIPENSIFYPKKNIYNKDWINAEIVFGSFETVKTYCNLYPNIQTYINNKIILHSEILITHHLMQNNIKFNEIDYDYELDNMR